MRRSSRNCCNAASGRSTGFSLVELLVAMAVMMTVMAVALGLATSSRRIYTADTARATANQGLRAAADLITTDLRQAGERLGDDFPAIEIIDGTGGAPDELIVRRNLLDTVLRVCRDVVPTDRKVFVAETINPPPSGCVPQDLDGDGWVDSHRVWRDWRVAHGGAVRAYIFDPSNGNGDFFDYRRDNKAFAFVLRPFGAPDLSSSYPVSNQPRLYLLEERRYRLRDGMLEAVLDGAGDQVQKLVPDMTDLTFDARFRDGTLQSTLGYADVWSELAAIEVGLDSAVPHGDNVVVRSRRFEILPRNVLSR